MKYNFYTFTCLSRPLYVAELIQFPENKASYREFLSPEELNLLAKRKHINKQAEFIFSRYIIKKVLEMSSKQAKLTTVKYCNLIKASGIFQQQELKQKLSLSHSGKFVAFSFCALKENIGVDIETITKKDVKPLINEFFCEEDKRLINASANPTKHFYQLWTEKEAVTKLVNTSIFTLLASSSAELNNNYHLESINHDDFIASLATNNNG